MREDLLAQQKYTKTKACSDLDRSFRQGVITLSNTKCLYRGDIHPYTKPPSTYTGE